jgi:hypothetical protein
MNLQPRIGGGGIQGSLIRENQAWYPMHRRAWTGPLDRCAGLTRGTLSKPPTQLSRVEEYYYRPGLDAWPAPCSTAEIQVQNAEWTSEKTRSALTHSPGPHSITRPKAELILVHKRDSSRAKNESKKERKT